MCLFVSGYVAIDNVYTAAEILVFCLLGEMMLHCTFVVDGDFPSFFVLQLIVQFSTGTPTQIVPKVKM